MLPSIQLLSIINIFIEIYNILIKIFLLSKQSSFKSEILRMLERIQTDSLDGTSCVVYITSRNIIKLSMKQVNPYMEQ